MDTRVHRHAMRRHKAQFNAMDRSAKAQPGSTRMPQSEQIQEERKRSQQTTHDSFHMHIGILHESNAIQEKKDQDVRAHI